MSSTLQAQVLEEAVLSVIGDRLGDALKAARTTTQTSLEETDVEKQGVRLPDGTKVASISAVNPDPKPEITDQEKFIDWVTKHAPGEVTERQVTIREVRPAYLTALVAEMTKAKAPEAVVEGGEVVTVDGVKMKQGTRTHSLRFEGGDEGRAKVVAALLSGDLAHLRSVKELTAGGEQ